MSKKQNKGPKILLIDIETAPILGSIWKLFDNNVALNQIERDWFLLSFSAKWLDDGPDKIIYMDQRNKRDMENDKELLKYIWKLLDKADILITQNGKSFDIKKINARLIKHGFKPYSSIRHIDTLRIARKHFGFTSNKLEYMTSKLCTKYKKSGHKKFSGFELWKECLAGNNEAWKEMETYNKLDVLSLEELYYKLQPWDNSINFNVYNDSLDHYCPCGSKLFARNGFGYSNLGKYQRYKCSKCGSEVKSRINSLSKEKRATLKK